MAGWYLLVMSSMSSECIEINLKRVVHLNSRN